MNRGEIILKGVEDIYHKKKKSKKFNIKNNSSPKLMVSLVKNWQLYTMLLLPITFYIVFMYTPIIGNIIAFRKYQPGGSIFGIQWVGMRYFNMFLSDAKFWSVFKNTVILSLSSLVIGFPMPIIFALFLNELKSLKFKKLVQITSYLPHFLSTIIICGMIMEVLAPNTGIINRLITTLGGSSISFMQNPNWFRPVYIISGIWQNLGWEAIIYIAALTNVDQQLYEAASIDGANKFQQMIHVSLAGIAPTIIIMLILAIGKLMTVGYEKVLLLYNPMTLDKADIISTYVYRLGIEANQYSYATAIGLLESVIGLTLVIIANKVSRKVSESSLW